ncbi:hypothetical protein OV079_29980 [Nannocystis pusilla]|uniref:Uncharacterized protein n=1 Tax=Nannocystis pusilla TaxID=889268 RepID=A0A9X3EUV5_9BACT|nr:hypothetical protein [Nannocystis pusilla]MCY1009720.1 hypothetical protein [Nannocystis pusilla]
MIAQRSGRQQRGAGVVEQLAAQARQGEAGGTIGVRRDRGFGVAALDQAKQELQRGREILAVALGEGLEGSQLEVAQGRERVTAAIGVGVHRHDAELGAAGLDVEQEQQAVEEHHAFAGEPLGELGVIEDGRVGLAAVMDELVGELLDRFAGAALEVGRDGEGVAEWSGARGRAAVAEVQGRFVVRAAAVTMRGVVEVGVRRPGLVDRVEVVEEHGLAAAHERGEADDVELGGAGGVVRTARTRHSSSRITTRAPTTWVRGSVMRAGAG